MSACRVTSRGERRLSIPASGRHRFLVRAWCAGSTSTATAKGIWPATAASTGPSSSIRWNPIATGRASSDANDFTYGQFGENFTVDGLSDQEVCIGDRYRIGGALFEVTQPRVTCYRVGIRMNEPEMAALLVAHGRPGFYLRVLEEGEVEAGDEIVQVAAGPERMSVAEIDALLYKPGHPRDQLERALRIPALSAGWRASLQALLEQQRGRCDDGKRRARSGIRPASGVGGIPPASRGAQDPRERQRDLAGARARRRAAPGGALARPVRRAAAEAGIRRPALMRSYSLSGEPGTEHYRVSVKREPGGAAGAYIDDKLQVGDVVDASAARGNFTLSAGRRRRRFPECRHRRDARARDASRAGGRSVAEGDLVAPRRP